MTPPAGHVRGMKRGMKMGRIEGVSIAITLPVIFPDVSLVLADEIFVNLAHADATWIRQGFDQTERSRGLPTESIRPQVVEVAYMNQYLSRKETPRPDQMQHVLLTTIFFNY